MTFVGYYNASYKTFLPKIVRLNAQTSTVAFIQLFTRQWYWTKKFEFKPEEIEQLCSID